MKIGVGLPHHIAGAPGSAIVDWARRAEQRGFDSVTTIDRLVYPSLDSIVALALAAAASSSLGLVTNILLAPLYPPAILAKQLATVAHAAGNRLSVGIGVGSREDDYTAAGVEFNSRGRILDDATKLMQHIWQGDDASGEMPLIPAPVHIPVLFGGKSQAAVRRATTLGDGWAAGSVRDYDGQSAFADRVRDAWRQAGRSGTPTIHASVNFAIGDAAVTDTGREHLARYYGFLPEYAALNVADMLTSPEDAQDTVRAYRDLGFDQLLFHPTVITLDQVDRLADAVL